MSFEIIARQILRDRGFELNPQGQLVPIQKPGATPLTPPPSNTPTRRVNFDPNEATPLPGTINNTGGPAAAPLPGIVNDTRVPTNRQLTDIASTATTRPPVTLRPPRRTFTPAENRILTRFGGSRRRSR